MSCLDQRSLSLVRSLIPYIIPLISLPDFPEAYCDVATAQILNDRNRMWQIMGAFNARHRCGRVEGKGHIWVKFGDLNIDFTAHQFPSLRSHVSNVDGYRVLVGSDSYFQSLGFAMLPQDQCEQQLVDAGFSLMVSEFGDCSPGIHWSRA